MNKNIAIPIIILIIYVIIRIDYLPKLQPTQTIILLKNKDKVLKINLKFNDYSINIIYENDLWLVSDEGKKIALQAENSKVDLFLNLATKPITLRLIDDGKGNDSKKIKFSLYGLADNQAQHLVFYKQKGKISKLTLGHYSPLKDGIYIKYNSKVYIANINLLEQSLRNLL